MPESDTSAFDAARANLLRHLTPSPLSRLAWTVWDRCAGGIVLLISIILTTILCIGVARGQEITIDRALSAIVAVESGCTRVGMGQIVGSWGYGQDGEVSPFQFHISVLRDLGVAGKSARIHRDPVYAESLARLHLVRLHSRFGNWPDAFAAWNGGPSGYQRRMARDYSQRVMNTAHRLASESN